MTSLRDFLLAVEGPPIDTRDQALTLLAALATEPEPATAHEWSGQLRRRAYIWIRAAALWPEFEPAAAASMAAWQAAEAEATRASVLIAAGWLPAAAD